MYRRRTCAALQTWGSALLIKAKWVILASHSEGTGRDFFKNYVIISCYFGSQCRHVLLDSFQSWSIYGIGWTPPLRTGRYHDHPYIQDLTAVVLSSEENLHIGEAKRKTAMTGIARLFFKTVNCAGLPGNRKKNRKAEKETSPNANA